MKMPLNSQTVNTLRQEGKTFQEIANMYGCSRQRIHQIANSKSEAKMKLPTKAELYAQVDALTKENIKLQEQLDAEERRRWEKKKYQAFAVLYRDVPFNKSEMQFITLEHIDKSGYWFTFHVSGFTSYQTYCVRHTDL